MAVHEQPMTLCSESGHGVEDVGQHGVDVVVVGDVGHPVHRVRERVAEPAQREDREVLLAVPRPIEVARPDARQPSRGPTRGITPGAYESSGFPVQRGADPPAGSSGPPLSTHGDLPSNDRGRGRCLVSRHP